MDPAEPNVSSVWLEFKKYPMPETWSAARGEETPIPTLPPPAGFRRTYALDGDPFDVPCSVSVEPAAVPPYTVGTVTDVVTVCAGNVVESEGTPDPFVTRTLLFAVARPAMTFALLEYRIWLTVVVAG